LRQGQAIAQGCTRQHVAQRQEHGLPALAKQQQQQQQQQQTVCVST
jgi:hypothetical protein